MPTRLALVRAYEDRCSPTYEWSVGGTYDSNAERREVLRATRLLPPPVPRRLPPVDVELDLRQDGDERAGAEAGEGDVVRI